jgi:hypothetical protein
MYTLIPHANRAPFRFIQIPAEQAVIELYRQLAESDQRMIHHVLTALIKCPTAN